MAIRIQTGETVRAIALAARIEADPRTAPFLRRPLGPAAGEDAVVTISLRDGGGPRSKSGRVWRLAYVNKALALHARLEEALATGPGAGICLVEDHESGPSIVAYESAGRRPADTVRRIATRLDAAVPQLVADALLRLRSGHPGVAARAEARVPQALTPVTRLPTPDAKLAAGRAFSVLEPLFKEAFAVERATRIVLLHAPPPDILDRLLARLTRYGAFISLESVVAALAAGRAPPPGFVLTFDDGYKQNVGLLEVLDRHACRATFYISTGTIGTRRPLWFMNKQCSYLDWKADLKREDLAGFRVLADACGLTAEDDLQWRFSPTPEEIRMIADRGHGIGVHTVDHPFLTRLTPAQIADQILPAHRRLTEILGAHDLPLDLAYPDGDHDDRVVAEVARLGVRSATTILPGPVVAGTDPLRLPRTGFGDDDEPDYAMMKFTSLYRRFKS